MTEQTKPETPEPKTETPQETEQPKPEPKPEPNKYETFYNLLTEITKTYRSIQFTRDDFNLGIDEMIKQLKDALNE